MASIQCLIYVSLMMMSAFAEGNHILSNGYQRGVEQVSRPNIVQSDEFLLGSSLSNEALSGSNSSQVKHVPKECEKKGYCENVPNYPNEKVIKNLMAKAGNTLSLVAQSSHDNEEFVHRLGATGTHQDIETCSQYEKNIQPDMVRDKQGQWQWVFNLPGQKQQFRITECNNTNRSCSSFLTAKGGKCCCAQRYTNHWIAIIYREKITFTSIELPSICKCVRSEQGVCLID